MTLALFVSVPPTLGYVAVFLLLAGETAGLLVPGETALIVAAVLASHGKLSLPLVIAAGAAGAIVGDNVGYLIGGRALRWLLTRGGRGRASREAFVARGERFFAKHGPKAVFLARFLPGLRLTGAWFAGASRMSWWRFAFWNALGGTVWAAAVAILSYELGNAAGGLLGLVGTVVLVAGAFLLFGHLGRGRPPAAPAIGEPAPPLALPTLDGGEASLEELRGTATLVLFLRHAG